MPGRLLRRALARVGVRVGLLGAALGLTACVSSVASAPPPRVAGSVVESTEDAPLAPTRTEVQEGFATRYGGKFTGRKTASGQIFDPNEMTAAHIWLPFDTWVEVKRVDTGATVSE